MTSGLKTIIYPVTDLAQAKTLYGIGPVYCRRFIQVLRNALQCSKENHHKEAERLPDRDD